MQTLTFDDVLSNVEQLEPEQQKTLIEIINKRLIESRRNEISHNIRESVEEYDKGASKGGSIQDLRKQLG